MRSGSLFNFACAPEDLPIVRPKVFDLLEQALGYEWTYRISLVEQYRRHLAFAEDVRARLEAVGVEVQDMVDAQSLIQDAGEHADFWTADPWKGPRALGDGAPYLSICAIYRDEAPYLREWIEFHRLVGVERFFLYDNVSEDDHLEVLAPYLEDGIVTVRRVARLRSAGTCLQRLPPLAPLRLALDRLHRRRRVPVLPDGATLARGARPTTRPGRVWRSPGSMFGTGGHRTRPQGLVIENYLRRIEQPDPIMNMKSIVDPTRVTSYVSGHHCAYSYMSAVDENHFPVDGHTLVPPSFERLRLNHYHYKSEEEFVAKFERWRAIGRRRHIPTAADLEQLRQREADEGKTDETILMFSPALRAALGS